MFLQSYQLREKKKGETEKENNEETGEKTSLDLNLIADKPVFQCL